MKSQLRLWPMHHISEHSCIHQRILWTEWIRINVFSLFDHVVVFIRYTFFSPMTTNFWPICLFMLGHYLKPNLSSSLYSVLSHREMMLRVTRASDWSMSQETGLWLAELLHVKCKVLSRDKKVINKRRCTWPGPVTTLSRYITGLCSLRQIQLIFFQQIFFKHIFGFYRNLRLRLWNSSITIP